MKFHVVIFKHFVIVYISGYNIHPRNGLYSLRPITTSVRVESGFAQIRRKELWLVVKE